MATWRTTTAAPARRLPCAMAPEAATYATDTLKNDTLTIETLKIVEGGPTQPRWMR